LHIVWDLAHAVRRSIHAYDIIPILDYALVSRVPAVHVYDVIPVHDYAYVNRRSVVHAYDVISQLDTATKSGNVTLSATDILTLTEWFFRVNKALKIFEGYIPYEFATASTIPTIYADDLFIIYDLGASVNAVKVASAFDKLIADGASYAKLYSPLFFSLLRRRVPVVSKTLGVFDTIAISERVDYTKSYNTLFFSLFRRKVPIRYLTLPVADKFDISDYASAKKIIIVAAGDYALITDSASARGATVILALDYGLLTDTASLTNRAVTVYDVIPIIDYGTAVRAILLEAKDYMLASDYIDAKKVPAITASDVLLADSISTAKSYSPLLFAVLRRRVPIVYKALGILDTAIIKDTASAVLIKKISVGDSLLADSYDIRNLAVHASDIVTVADYGTAVKAKVLDVLDYISAADNVYSNRAVVITALERLITDHVTYIKSYSPLFFTLFQRRVPIVYETLSVLDVVDVKDSLSTVVVKTVPAYDYIGFDLVSYTKLYETLSVLDVVDVKDSAYVIPIKVVSVFDSMVVSDHATAKMISIPVSDYIMYDSVVPISYVALSVFDRISLPDSASVVARKVVSVLDVVPVADRVDVKNIAISVSDYVMYDSAVPVRYVVLSVFDIISLPDSASVVARKVASVLDVVPVADRVDVKNIAVHVSDFVVYDSASAAKIEVVSVSDFVMYDYVPSMSPSSVRYRSLYANVGMRTIPVLDRITPYESVWVGSRVATVNARDYLVSDGAAIVKRSVHAYDVVVVRENVNIVRL